MNFFICFQVARGGGGIEMAGDHWGGGDVVKGLLLAACYILSWGAGGRIEIRAVWLQY